MLSDGKLEFTKTGGVLYFQGTGLDPGTWTGIDGHTTEYSPGLLASNAAKFAGKKIKTVSTEHEQTAKDVVGWSTGWKVNEKGGVDIEGYIFDEEEIFRLETMAASGQPVGISPELKAPSTFDATKGWWIAQELDVSAFDFVPNPACKTSWVTETEQRKLSGGPVSGFVPHKPNLSDGGESGKGDNPKMGGDTGEVPKTFKEALALFEGHKDLSDAEKSVYEFNAFLSKSLEEGKTLEESISAWKELGKNLADDDNLCAKCGKEPCECKAMGDAGDDPDDKPVDVKVQLMNPETATKLLAAVNVVNEFAESQRLLTVANIATVVGEIKEIDKTFDDVRFLAALGEGNEAVKFSLLSQYKASIEHYKSTVPEGRRELSGDALGGKYDEIAKKFFGADKYDIDAMARAL